MIYIDAAADSHGAVMIGTTNPARQLHVAGTGAMIRVDRNDASPGLIFNQTAVSDLSTTLKVFYFGMNASGVNNGRFYMFLSTFKTAVQGKRQYVKKSSVIATLLFHDRIKDCGL
ncbi:MAG: hypothetical protein FJ146_19670 [Deltaproteobacteria bacterium]|nr:hypothetical protein [Deltaproteobacteria bacterium]